VLILIFQLTHRYLYPIFIMGTLHPNLYQCSFRLILFLFQIVESLFIYFVVMFVFNDHSAFYIDVNFITITIATKIIADIIPNIYCYVFKYIMNLISVFIIIHWNKRNLVNFISFFLHLNNYSIKINFNSSIN
jgi:hypothetical protein